MATFEGFGNTDHRGTIEYPGRVVTLLNRQDWLQFQPLDPHPYPEQDVCWGVAYQIDQDHAEDVLNHLNLREINGYSLVETTVHHPHRPSIPHALVYIAPHDNSEFLGPSPLQDMAKQIAFTRGPSGPNSEYLLALVAALKDIAPDHPEPHVYELASAVENLLSQQVSSVS